MSSCRFQRPADADQHLLSRTRRHFFRDCALGLGSLALLSQLRDVEEAVPGGYLERTLELIPGDARARTECSVSDSVTSARRAMRKGDPGENA